MKQITLFLGSLSVVFFTLILPVEASLQLITPGQETTISVCNIPPEVGNDGIIAARDCRDVQVKLQSDGYLGNDGARYERRCISGETRDSGGGLVLAPSEDICYIVMVSPPTNEVSTQTSASNRDAVSAAQGFVPCGGADQDPCEFCHLVEMGNRILQWLIIVLSVVAGIIFAIAGLRLVTSGGNPAAKDTAKSMFTSVIVGFLLVLSSWLIVDTLMKALVDPEMMKDGGKIGPWNRVECVGQPELAEVRGDVPLEAFQANVSSWQGIIADGGLVGDPALAPELPIEGDCSPENLQAQGMTARQAQVFSCIAIPESGCQLNAQNDWSSARGAFQIVRGLDTPCHNLNIPECTQAANASGYNISGNLNCSTVFIGGTDESNPSRARQGMENLFNACNAAADDFGCNVAAARCLYEQDNAGYAPWLGDSSRNHHRVQRACVARYGQ